jgi:hypothetical protein
VRSHRFLWFLIVVCAASLWIACSNSNDPVTPPGPTVVPDSVSFSKHVQPIYTSRCAISGCHVAPDPRAGLNLTKGVAYANTVNVPAVQYTGVRVLPNDPANSILYLLVQDGLMPARGDRLSSIEVQIIKKWIEQGALNN